MSGMAELKGMTGPVVRFDYLCPSCDLLFEKAFKPGKDKNRQKCPNCGKMASKYFGTINATVQFKGGGFPSNDMKFKKDMTRRNEEAGKRMRKNKPPVTTVAHDYGNGDIREVKK